ncbi:helix-turn-helix domain-containing protein [Streptomyces sp. NPDC050508]
MSATPTPRPRSCTCHPNTFRYRLQRIRDVSGFDPRDAETRFLRGW